MPGKPLSAEAVAAILEAQTPKQKAEGKLLGPGYFTRRSGREINTERFIKGWRGHKTFSDLSGNYITTHDIDQGLKCLARGCATQTTFKVRGIPKCSIHALMELGRLLDEKDGVFMPTLVASPDSPRTGQLVTIVASGFNDSDDLTLTIKHPNGDQNEVTVQTDSSGDYTFTDVVSTEQPGHLRFLAVDAADATADLDVVVTT